MTTLTLPKPKLGDVTAITIATPDIENSLAFYTRLGFWELLRGDFPFSWMQITDGALLIMLRKDTASAISLTYYTKELDKAVAGLEEAGISFVLKPEPTDFIKRYLFKSPDGLAIALVTFVEGFQQPPGPTLLTMSQSDFFTPAKYVNQTCGIYGEFAHPVSDLEASISFWEQLGFAVLSKNQTPYPWAILSDGLAIVGLHQTTTFNYPVITFFAADMKDKLDKLTSEGLSDFKETGQGSVVLTTPEGQHINLFKMGM